MTKDWIGWHREYDEPNSSLARRLTVVRGCLAQALELLVREEHRDVRLISMCAGDGRDVLPVLAADPGAGRACRALLVELDPQLAERARASAAELAVPGVEVRTADAGVTDGYRDFLPAHVVMACGVFGNITAEDARRTVSMLPQLLVTGGIVIWTRGRDSRTDLSATIRSLFTDHGFTELTFTAPSDARFRVGVHRLAVAGGDPPRPGVRMFSFV